MNSIPNTCLIVLCCAVLSGCGSVRGQGPERPASVKSTQTQNPGVAPPDAKEGGIEQWKSCAPLLHPEGVYTVSEIQAMFESPQNIAQLLLNLKIAAERGLLLQPSFYDEATLGKFFHGTTVTLAKPHAYQSKGTSAIEANVTSDIFPKLAIKVSSNCTESKYEANHGRSAAENVHANGFLNIAVDSDAPITVADVRSALGREDGQDTGRGWDADGMIYTPFDEGRLGYRFGRDDSHTRNLFYFKLKRVSVIEDSDVLTRIEMRYMQYHILENQ